MNKPHMGVHLTDGTHTAVLQHRRPDGTFRSPSIRPWRFYQGTAHVTNHGKVVGKYRVVTR